MNSIVLEVPDHHAHGGRQDSSGDGDKQAVIGTYGTTSRPDHRPSLARSGPRPGPVQQVQREGNSLINELIIGTGSKDRSAWTIPRTTSQFANFFLDPFLARCFQFDRHSGSSGSAHGLADRWCSTMPPICPGCGPDDAGPVADLLRLNTGIPPTPVGKQKRLGLPGW